MLRKMCASTTSRLAETYCEANSYWLFSFLKHTLFVRVCEFWALHFDHLQETRPVSTTGALERPTTLPAPSATATVAILIFAVLGPWPAAPGELAHKLLL